MTREKSSASVGQRTRITSRLVKVPTEVDGEEVGVDFEKSEKIATAYGGRVGKMADVLSMGKGDFKVLIETIQKQKVKGATDGVFIYLGDKAGEFSEADVLRFANALSRRIREELPDLYPMVSVGDQTYGHVVLGFNLENMREMAVDGVDEDESLHAPIVLVVSEVSVPGGAATDTITIPRSEYDALRADSERLMALQRGSSPKPADEVLRHAMKKKPGIVPVPLR